MSYAFAYFVIDGPSNITLCFFVEIWFGAVLDLPCGLAVLVMGIMFSFDQVCYSFLVTNLVLACLFDLEDFSSTASMDGSCLHAF